MYPFPPVCRAGADINATNNFNGGTPLHCASTENDRCVPSCHCLSCLDDKGSALEFCLVCRALRPSPFCRMRRGNKEGRKNCVQALVKAGADVDMKDMRGKKAWQYSEQDDVRAVRPFSPFRGHPRPSLPGDDIC